MKQAKVVRAHKALAKTLLQDKALERRLRDLEEVAHEPFDFTRLVARLEELEAQVSLLKRREAGRRVR